MEARRLVLLVWALVTLVASMFASLLAPALARGEERSTRAAAVGAPLPELTTLTESASAADSAEPPEPAPFSPPPWLTPPDAAPGAVVSSEETAAKDPAVDRIARAFDLDAVTVKESTRAEIDDVAIASDIRGPNRPDSDASVDVQLASATALPPLDPRVIALRKEVEQLAEQSRSVVDLTEVIRRCGGEHRSFPDTRNQRALATVVSWAYNRRGEMHAERGDDRTAYDDFARAATIDPSNAAALHNRGLTLAEYGRHAAALADFDAALRLEPELLVALGNRGELNLSLGRPLTAEADFAEAIRLSPGNAAYFAGRAAARRDLGRVADAVRDLNEAIDLNPHRADTFAERGALYAQVGYYEQAVADFDAALRVDARCVAAYQSLAWLLATCDDAAFRDAEKALESARRLLRLGDTGDPLVLDTVAAAHASAGETAAAVRYEQQALLVAGPEHWSAFDARLALYRSGKPYRQPARK